jgi:hypothetical protein
MPPDSHDDLELSRRRLMKGAGVAGGAAATGGAALSLDASPVEDADAIAPLAVAGVAVGAAATGYLAREVELRLTGEEATDKDAYNEATKEDALAEVESRAASMHAANDKVFTVMENRLSDSKNIAWARGKSKYIEERAASKDHATAKSNAVDEVESYYATIQTNLGKHHADVILKIDALLATLEAAGWTDAHALYNDPVIARVPDGSSGTASYEDGQYQLVDGDRSFTLADGSTYDLTYIRVTDPDQHVDLTIDSNEGADGSDGTSNFLEVQRATDGTYQTLYNCARAQGLWDQIISLNSTMESEIQTWADTLDSNRSQSEIADLPTEDPSLLASEYASETGHYGYAGADLAALGLSTTFSSSSLIYLEENDVTVTGQIYLTTDRKLDVGVTYNPDTITGAVYLAYQIEDSAEVTGSTSTATSTATATPTGTTTSTATAAPAATTTDTETKTAGLVRLEQDFTIVEAKAADGSTASSISFESANDQTSDVTLTQEQMQEIRDLRQQLEDAKRRAAFNDGGGGFDLSGLSIGGLSGSVVALILAGAGALWFADSS